ncbi:MAG: prolipoprotein diacylglyceryl transferase [Bacteroidales bacterium]|nr:prolipoprotein diacylglyceryl transferase [Bacteroidales bacterium]
MSPLAIHWNVDPVIINIGSFGLRWYSLGFLVAFLLGYYIIERMFKQENVREDYLGSLFLYIFLAILIGARLGHCLFYEPDYFLTSEHWVEIVWPFQNGHYTGFQGLASHGAALGILIGLWLYQRKYGLNIWWFLDRLVIVVALGGAFVRLGNLFNSEIYGVETSMPWGFVFERNGETVAKHPTQLYESLSYFLIFGVSLWYYARKKGQFKTGTIFGWWLVALFGVRLLIEFVKNDQVDFEAGMVLNMGQLLSVPFIIGGLVLAWLAYKEKLPQGPFPKGEKVKFNDTTKKKKK